MLHPTKGHLFQSTGLNFCECKDVYLLLNKLKKVGIIAGIAGRTPVICQYGQRGLSIPVVVLSLAAGLSKDEYNF